MYDVVYNSVFLYLSYTMNSAVWTSYSDVTEKFHENLIQCSDYYARNSQNFHSVFSFISVWRKVVDFNIDSLSYCMQATVFVSAALKFASYNCDHDAKTLWQVHFSQCSFFIQNAWCQTSTSFSPALISYHAVVIISLLMYELVQDLIQTVDYQMLDMYDQISEFLFITDNKTEWIATWIFSYTIKNLKNFIICDLLSDMWWDTDFVQQITDWLRLATAVNKNEFVFLSESVNVWQATDDLLKTWFCMTHEEQKYNIFVVIQCLQVSESDNDFLYDLFVHSEFLWRKNSKIKLIFKKKKCMKLIIKKKKSMKSRIKKKKHTKSNIKKKRIE